MILLEMTTPERRFRAVKRLIWSIISAGSRHELITITRIRARGE